MITSGQNITKLYGGDTVFTNISFDIRNHSRVGIVGRNGSGKSTLLKIMAGIEQPDQGQIHWRKHIVIGYLHQIPEYNESVIALDVVEEAFSNLLEVKRKLTDMEQKLAQSQTSNGVEHLLNEYGKLQDYFMNDGGYEIEGKIKTVINGLGIEALMEKKFQMLSGGEKTKVCLAKELLKKPDLLLLDEPTNHLDLQAVDWLTSFIKDYEGTIVMVSHDRYFLDQTVSMIMDLEDEGLTNYHTNYSDYVKEKESRLLQEFQKYEDQQKKIKKMKESIKRLREWANQANPPNAGLHKKASSMEKALNRMEKVKKPVSHRKIHLNLAAEERSGKDTLVIENMTKSFSGEFVLESIDMHLRFQDRAVLVGENGSGKTTLIKLILHHLLPDEGEVRIGSNCKIGYLAQQVFTESENQEKTVLQMFRDIHAVAEGEARGILANFLFYGYAVYKKVKQLSGGERMRLRLAQLMYQNVNFLILDEPTNHLDIESREVLEQALQEFQGTILAVSHDRYFIELLFNQTYILNQRRLSYFNGSFTYAWEKWCNQIQQMAPPIKEAIKKVERESTVKQNIHQTDGIEEEMEELEEKLQIIERKMMTGEALSMLQDLQCEKEQCQRELDYLYKKWSASLLEE
ncbi:ribosomal protection-like ABC-F family protein [Cytobacillus kochii]|uniref:ribosomal protection-like ABC-F family protein n=1 Tax=Cytobacillus kochii TaxID=859143 RepID=UPI00203FF637|nr:ABC-F family ATP-binding cassette domain-containing protein [Cytobacillus kochii]MCM3324046.1 ATP-binding cassette domain-containing protein [Cytobacillus kochii]MCM3346550.1 ATP-binding cassette domain-containing protein [Cytobacillus kochii]